MENLTCSSISLPLALAVALGINGRQPRPGSFNFCFHYLHSTHHAGDQNNRNMLYAKRFINILNELIFFIIGFPAFLGFFFSMAFFGAIKICFKETSFLAFLESELQSEDNTSFLLVYLVGVLAILVCLSASCSSSFLFFDDQQLDTSWKVLLLKHLKRRSVNLFYWVEWLDIYQLDFEISCKWQIWMSNTWDCVPPSTIAANIPNNVWPMNVDTGSYDYYDHEFFHSDGIKRSILYQQRLGHDVN